MGSPYVEDYYYQAFVYKHYNKRNRRTFAPESGRSLPYRRLTLACLAYYAVCGVVGGLVLVPQQSFAVGSARGVSPLLPGCLLGGGMLPPGLMCWLALPAVRELAPTERLAADQVAFVKLEGLGKVPFSNIRRCGPAAMASCPFLFPCQRSRRWMC
jgi:hypothetical protein